MQDSLKHQCGIVLLLQLSMKNVSDHEHNHGKSVESAFVSAVELPNGEELLQNDDDGVQG
jgi:hypothetical protein